MWHNIARIRFCGEGEERPSGWKPGYAVRLEPLRRLYRFWAAFAGANSDAIVHGEDENFAVTNLAFFTCLGSSDDRVHGRFDEVVVDGNLQLDFAEQIDGNLVAAIRTDLAFLPTESLAIENGQAEHFDFG